MSEKAVNSAQDVQDAFRKFSFHPVSKQLIFHLWGNQEPDPLVQPHPLLHPKPQACRWPHSGHTLHLNHAQNMQGQPAYS